uniref:F-box domain-containing protein n=1 Tax=Brassica oleracea var. oleracea TaxID=109376 RepID=A0A0D3CHY2_BRAOL
MLEEILSSVPVKSIVTVRSTCKNWNVLTEDQRFANKHIEKAAAASQREKEVVLHRSFYCNGLLLCLWRNVKLRLLVWNPYWGKTRWINCPTKHSYHCEVFAFGYDKSCRTHKILWLSRDDNMNIYIDIYDLSCGLWKTPPDVAFHSNVIEYTKASLTLKGNTYWHVESGDGFLHCFDFTRERFGPHLPLPSDINHRCSVSLSSVKEEKLAVLLEQTLGEFEIAVWEEKKTVVAFDDFNNWYNTYIIDGESGHSREWYRKNYLGHGFA